MREIINEVEAVTGQRACRRRSQGGDPPALYADSSKAQKELAWEVQYTDIKDIIETAWRWHLAHPSGYED